VPLFDIGCKLIGTFIDDMATNPTMVSGTENIDYHALSASCKQRIKQEGVMAKATKAGETKSAPEKPKSTAAPSKPEANSVPLKKPESVSDAQQQLKAARQAARKAARQAARQQ
jgi:hypothetical protein